jgi:hypothetical protein
MLSIRHKIFVLSGALFIACALFWVIGCGEGFDAIHTLRQVSVEEVDLGTLELPVSHYEKPMRKSDPLTLSVPADLGRGGSITLMAELTETYTQPHLFSVVEEVEENSSVAGAQTLAETVVQFDGDVTDSDTSAIILTKKVHDFVKVGFTTNENRVALLTVNADTPDFEMFVIDDDGSTVLASSIAVVDEDGDEHEVEMVPFTTDSKTRYFGIGKQSSDGSTAVDYYFTHLKVTAGDGKNTTKITARSLNLTGNQTQAYTSTADSMSPGETIKVDGEDKQIEHVYEITSDHYGYFSIALRINSADIADLDFYVVDATSGELYGSSTLTQAAEGPGIESEVVYLPEDATAYILVDATSGSSNYLIAAQPISMEFDATPLLVASEIKDPSSTELFALTDECYSVSYLTEDCDCKGDGLFSEWSEFTNILIYDTDITALTFVLPNNNVTFPLVEEKVPSGDYSVALSGIYGVDVTVDSSHTLSAKAKALIKRDNDPNFGRINVNLHLLGASVSDPAKTEKGQERVTQILADVETIYSQVGIELGTVNVIEVSGTGADALTVDFDESSTDAFQQVFSLSTKTEGYMNVFLIDSFKEASILGISLGIPGVPVLDGYQTSALLFAMYTPIDEMTVTELEMLSSTMAHEMGHFLGLYHPTEAGGYDFDPLTDTPECDVSHDLNLDGYVVYEECQEAGGDNLMFWVYPMGGSVKDQIELTPQQGFVMNTNHYVR